MKMTINKEQLMCKDVERVKADMKEFKSMYTDGDLRYYAYKQIQELYEKLTGEQYPTAVDVVRVNVEAFAYDWMVGTHFRVEMLIDSWDEFDVITFYATKRSGEGMVIDTTPHWNCFKNRNDYMFNVRRFKRVGALIQTITQNGIEEAV
jgi:hypothetical protein